MMAAGTGSEEGGPVTAGAAGGGGAAGSSAYPAVCRVKIPAALPVAAAAPYPGLAEAEVAGTLGGGAGLGSGFLGPGSVAGALGGAGLSGGGAAAGVAGAAAAGPGGEMALTKGTTSLPAETFGAGGGFPPLPPPPQLPALGAGLGTVDEGDSLDGPEYEEEEVAIPLTAPPTNHVAEVFGSLLKTWVSKQEKEFNEFQV
ncbi:Ras GTPase-activating protein 1 [Camelus dromedarius]|uniref:Ras GTPase-activating protein 1 n=1 Tax=Camelus dromedarius TaxID=9838 RepID=A0A5N4ECE3_CAMDR|nr:Ras GTPase-activating protein 1 [Camelus dromedarius]